MDRSTAPVRFGATLTFVLIPAILTTGAGVQVGWGNAILRQKAEWYGSGGAHGIADSVIGWQSAEGGWPKNTDLSAPAPSPLALEEIARRGGGNTIDNDATTTPIRFLALMVQATRDTRYRMRSIGASIICSPPSIKMGAGRSISRFDAAITRTSPITTMR